MTKYNIVWVAWMSRWGEPGPTHAYAAGVFDDPHEARLAGEQEAQYRGGKYIFQHCPSWLDLKHPPAQHASVQEVKEVYVAWVQKKIDTEYSTRVHFLGCFYSVDVANQVGMELYPGWKVHSELFEVQTCNKTAVML
jgi:hypothetical protein